MLVFVSLLIKVFIESATRHPVRDHLSAGAGDRGGRRHRNIIATTGPDNDSVEWKGLSVDTSDYDFLNLDFDYLESRTSDFNSDLSIAPTLQLDLSSLNSRWSW